MERLTTDKKFVPLHKAGVFSVSIPYFFLLFLICFLISRQGIAQVYNTSGGLVEFDSSVPLHSFTGHSNYLTGQIDLSEQSVDFYIDLNTIETGIGARDKDMRATLETGTYPFAEFYGKLNTLPVEGSLLTKPQQVTVKGKFKVHGVSRDVSIDGTLQKTDQGLKVKASWKLNIRDYDIEPPGILFYRVSEIQKIRIEALLTPKM